MILCLFFLCLPFLGGCVKKERAKEEKINIQKEIDFTICREENIPAELRDIINKKKENPFQISFCNEAYTYYVVGYGTQPTSGYSIVVRKIEQKNEKICVDTVLLGPRKNDDKIKKKESYPYIVIKLEKREEDAIFLP